MGAHLEIRIYDLESRDKVSKAFDIDCQNARHEDGHGGYSGSIAQFSCIVTKREDRPFASEYEAEEFIADNHQKWDQTAFAVKFYANTGISAKVKKAEEATKKAYKNLQDVIRSMIEKIKSRKSPLISCKGCGSKVNKKYIFISGNNTDIVCPLCRASVMSVTQRKILQGLYTKLEKARKNADEVMKAEAKKAEAKKDDRILWLVGGWVSE